MPSRILDTVNQRPAHVYEVTIRTTPERLWAAIISPEYTRRYFYGGWYESTWQPGTAYRTRLDDGTTPFEGTLLEVDPPRRLAYTFHYVGDEATRGERPSRVTWEIAPLGDACKLTVVHDRFAEGETRTAAKVDGGWPFILSNLKSVLETGKALQVSAA
ncbi:MAG TPA: SRPBCC family protein [Chloroflexota bacterium]|nr:SRPBCC family protein [Chloroflexota bacterium]